MDHDRGRRPADRSPRRRAAVDRLDPDKALGFLLGTVFVVGAAERLWTVAREGAAPALLPAPPLEGAAVRPLPDHLDALRRLSLRTGFLAVPAAAAALLAATLLSNLLGAGIEWFTLHQAALGSYVAAGLFAASVSVLYFVELPGGQTPRPRSPLEGLRRPTAEKGRTGAVGLLVIACATVAGAVAAAAAVAVLHAYDLGGGPVTFALLILALSGATAVGIRTASSVLTVLSRRRLLALAIALTGIALLAMGLVPDTATVLLLSVLAGYAAGSPPTPATRSSTRRPRRPGAPGSPSTSRPSSGSPWPSARSRRRCSPPRSARTGSRRAASSSPTAEPRSR